MHSRLPPPWIPLAGIELWWARLVNWWHVSTYARRFLWGASRSAPIAGTRHGEHAPKRRLPAEAVDFFSRHRVYVTLTTIPSRISRVPMILRQLDLEPVTEVLLAIPDVFGRDGSRYVVSDELRAHPKLRVLRAEKDFGPITKLLPSAEHLLRVDPEAFLLVIDDDQDYPRGMVTELLYAAFLAQGRAVVGGSGQRFRLYGMPSGPDACVGSFFRLPDRSLSLAEIDVVEGYGGIVLPVRLVEVSLMHSLSALSQECFKSDDVVISMALAHRGIPRYRIAGSPYFHVGRIRPQAYGLGGDALFRVGSRSPERWWSVFDNQHARNYGRACRTIRQWLERKG